MNSLPKKLSQKLQRRADSNSLRTLSTGNNLVDFSSNDYLGFAADNIILDSAYHLLHTKGVHRNGATGSRLLTGNHTLYTDTEIILAKLHNAESALLFNSGYDANIGLFSSVPQRGDIIFYDEFIHASIRDGILMSNAKSYKFAHNNISDLEKKIREIYTNQRNKKVQADIYIVTESVFSMDGDIPDLQHLSQLCRQYQCHLIIDEAHATGVFGSQGVGLLQELQLEDSVFARINTFGKAMGCHGAVILGSEKLRSFLINFARSFIYTTGLPPHSLATIQAAYSRLETTQEIGILKENIAFFNQQVAHHKLTSIFIKSNSAIHCCIIPGNEQVKKVANAIQRQGYNVKPILSPTVPEGKERLRFCLHSYNNHQEIEQVLTVLATFVS